MIPSSVIIVEFLQIISAKDFAIRKLEH